jgi:class 3 adenylate cyclase
MEIPETRYAKTVDGVHIAYQVVGDGPVDVVFVPWEYSNIEVNWELPEYSGFVRELSRHARVMILDCRGIGASDRGTGPATPTLEARMDDIRAVMDAIGSDRACLFGIESGGTLCFAFAAIHPERTAAVVTLGALATGLADDGYPWAWTHAEWDDWLDRVEREWGSEAFVRELTETVSPSLAKDPGYLRTVGRILRLAASPGDAAAHDRIQRDTDVRHVLPTIQAPTLLIHRKGDRLEPVGQGRYIADRIPGASLLELEGDDHIGTLDDLLPHVIKFLRSMKEHEAQFDRFLATVMFTDIVGSTERSAALGDRAWHELLERHDATVRAMLGRYRGREVDTAGDGFFAMFDGPARAIRCADAITKAVRTLDLEVRAGLHTGEVELKGDDVRGIAVHIGARVGALAGPSQVLVSQTVKDLVAGSGLSFEDAGEHELKGVPDRWHLYRVVS